MNVYLMITVMVFLFFVTSFVLMFLYYKNNIKKAKKSYNKLSEELNNLTKKLNDTKSYNDELLAVIEGKTGLRAKVVQEVINCEFSIEEVDLFITCIEASDFLSSKGYNSIKATIALYEKAAEIYQKMEGEQTIENFLEEKIKKII